ncbi:MAG: ABC transporter ATP-binding protein [Kyrpidia sp.]|nr:ABC transporter ATP-binding protein [Kyrpidia sp.]
MIILEDVRYIRGRFCLEISGSLGLGPGLVLVVGPNGAGKSTLLEVLATAAPPDDGEIRYDGQRLAGDLPGIRGRIGYLPAKLEPYGHMTPIRFLKYMAHLKGVDPGPEVERILGQMGLGPVRDVKIARLSRGMHQRLGIAQALLGFPDILFLDEPLIHLDSPERREVIRFLTRYACGRTVVAVSHELDEWDGVDTILWLEDGRPAFCGPPAVWTSGLSQAVWSGVVKPDRLARLDPARLLRCRREGQHVAVRLFAPECPEDGFRREAPTLEEAYVIRRWERGRPAGHSAV